jgi:FkbM family methyltransferase
MDYSFVVKNKDGFQKTYDRLADQKSKDIFIAFINAKLSGDPAPLYEFAEFDQYFNKTADLGEEEIFVDSGAFDGDSIIAFNKHVAGKYRKIYAFEPNSLNQEKLLRNIKDEGIDRVELIKKGTWSHATTLKFSTDANMSSASDQGDMEVEVDSIDNCIGDNPVTYIKMDIEGAELESLKGAKNAITKNFPKLAICVYHKPEDLIDIPAYILSLSEDYDLYLRHHQHMSWELVLYAIPKYDSQ